MINRDSIVIFVLLQFYIFEHFTHVFTSGAVYASETLTRSVRRLRSIGSALYTFTGRPRQQVFRTTFSHQNLPYSHSIRVGLATFSEIVRHRERVA